MAKARVIKVDGDPAVQIHCPGCDKKHRLMIESSTDEHNWSFNNDYERPTFSPSLLVTGTEIITDEERDIIMAGGKVEPRPFRCHSFIRDGNIQFLNDCTHDLAGQTVPLPEID